MSESTVPYDADVQTPVEVASANPPLLHILKTTEVPFQQVWDGLKLAELRNSHDRNFVLGDLLMLREVETGYEADEVTPAFIPTGRYILAEITHVTKCSDWMGAGAGGFLVLSFKVLTKGERGPIR